MFERDVQHLVTSFVENQLSEKNFLKYSRPWPNYKGAYDLMVNFAKENKLDVLAANIPRRYASFVFNNKTNILIEMPDYEKEFISKFPIYAPQDAYWKKLYELFRERMPMERIIRLYRAQCIKDDTMSESMVNYFKEYNNQVSMFAAQGSFHSDEYL
jgi:uncharacterized iron-regulated protein